MNELKRHHLSQCDKIIVASEWAKQVVNDEVPDKPVYVSPLGVDHTVLLRLQIDRKKSLSYSIVASGK